MINNWTSLSFLNASFYPLVLIILLWAISCNTQSSNNKNTSYKLSPAEMISVNDATARPAFTGGNGAVFLRIHNKTDSADTLIGVSSEIAEVTEVHKSYKIEPEVTGMRPAGNLAIPKGESIELKPGGIHIMLMGLKKTIGNGDSLQIKLAFAKQGTLSVAVPVSIDQ